MNLCFILSVRFPSIERMDRGDYVCTASNNVGPSVNMTASLIVRYGPKIGIPRPRVQQALGYDVMLQCKVDSYPTSAIDWLRDGEVVKNENRFNVAHFNTGTTSTLTTLKVLDWKVKYFWRFWLFSFSDLWIDGVRFWRVSMQGHQRSWRTYTDCRTDPNKDSHSRSSLWRIFTAHNLHLHTSRLCHHLLHLLPPSLGRPELPQCCQCLLHVQYYLDLSVWPHLVHQYLNI